MNTYFDTSIMVKLVLAEPASEHALTLWRRTDRALASALTYVEARAALAAARRALRIADASFADVKQQFERNWRQVVVIAAGRPLLRFASSLAEIHGLRGYDAVHLASALAITEPVIFASSDTALRRAAQTEGLPILAMVE